MGAAESSMFNSLEKNSNCKFMTLQLRLSPAFFCLPLLKFLSLTGLFSVSGPELMRLKKRFMKLDKDGSGSIDKDEFLQIPQIANNPLAHRMIAIFDEEYVGWRSPFMRIAKLIHLSVEVERLTSKNLSEVWALSVVKEVVMRSWDVRVKTRLGQPDYMLINTFISRFQGVRHGSRRLHL